jgi:hypothetical protein
VHRHAGLGQRVDRGQRRAVRHGRDPPGIAVGEHLQRSARAPQRRQQRRAVQADRPVAGSIVVADCSRLRPGGLRARGRGQRRHPGGNPVQRPAQVDRGGARGQQIIARPRQAGVGRVGAQREGQPVSGDRADQRRAPDLHRPDRPCAVLLAAQLEEHVLEGQQGLVAREQPAPRVDPEGAGSGARH